MPRRPTAARQRPASAISRAGWAGRRRPWARPATRATGARAATRPSASANIPGARRKKTTCCRRRTRSRSASRPSSSPASPATASGAGSRARPAARPRARRSPARTSSPSRACPTRSIAPSSGVSVTVKLPDGRELAEPDVVVEDLFIVALGDSFASGESNPDRPVQFSADRARWSTIRPWCARSVATRGRRPRAPRRATASPPARTSTIRRCCRGGFMDDEAAERFHKLGSREFRRRVREGGGALAEPRLPPLAIRLSVPRGDRARAREPPSLDDAGELRLLGRRGDGGPVPRHGPARGAAEIPGGKVRAAARPAERSHLPRRPLAERELYAAELHARQHAGFGAADQQVLVPAAIAQAPDRRRAAVDRRQRRGLRRARGLCLDRERHRPRADRRPGRRLHALRRRTSRASISRCWTSA